MDYQDKMYLDAKKFVIEKQEANILLLMRKFVIGYNRSNYLLNKLEENKIISKHNVKGIREVLVKE